MRLPLFIGKVPIFFAGNGISAQTVSRLVGPQDIAATIFDQNRIIDIVELIAYP